MDIDRIRDIHKNYSSKFVSFLRSTVYPDVNDKRIILCFEEERLEIVDSYRNHIAFDFTTLSGEKFTAIGSIREHDLIFNSITYSNDCDFLMTDHARIRFKNRFSKQFKYFVKDDVNQIFNAALAKTSIRLERHKKYEIKSKYMGIEFTMIVIRRSDVFVSVITCWLGHNPEGQS